MGSVLGKVLFQREFYDIVSSEFLSICIIRFATSRGGPKLRLFPQYVQLMGETANNISLLVENVLNV